MIERAMTAHLFDPMTDYCVTCGVHRSVVVSRWGRATCAAGNVTGISHLRAQARADEEVRAMMAQAAKTIRAINAETMEKSPT